MGRYTGKTCRLIFMLVITVVFFVAEIVAGYAGNSIALVSDSFNMLSDMVSLCVGLMSARLSRRSGSERCSYGLGRVEVVGALSNAVFLTALLFSISAEAVKRLSRPEPIDDPLLVLVVGSLGLAVNVVGLVIFQDCRWLCGKNRRGAGDKTEEKPVMNGEAGPLAHEADSPQKDKNQSEGQPLNIRGVLLHVLNDALGSVVVVVASVLFYVWPLPADAPCNWQCYVDPSLTLVMVVIILASAIPLMKETTTTLLQMTPPDMTVSTILEKVRRLPAVLSVHEAHVWELVKDRNVATLHVKVNSEFNKFELKSLQSQIREVFHNAGVHSVTIQVEISDGELDSSQCSNPCMSSGCLKLSCCPTEPTLASDSRVDQSSIPLGEVSIDLGDGNTNLLRERDTKHIKVTGKVTETTQF
ncbi:zinc transporter 10-like [Astyanax mexicanus]|uniref:Zinc transporter 10-like n=1 Tax=Astyanax mexicanus TaxID=7994 RepID=A0A8T2LRN3_ASTMX|nr:zinc transporter 10-like [Astyanax mexicanus]